MNSMDAILCLAQLLLFLRKPCTNLNCTECRNFLFTVLPDIRKKSGDSTKGEKTKQRKQDGVKTKKSSSAEKKKKSQQPVQLATHK